MSDEEWSHPDIDPASLKLAREERLRELAWEESIQEESKRRRRERLLAGTPPPSFGEFEEFVSGEATSLEWRVEGLLPVGENIVFAAGAKCGKTTLVVNLIKALSCGHMFLGRYPVKPLADGEKVVLLDFEMTRGMLFRWLEEAHVRRSAFEVLCFRGRAAHFDICDPAVRKKWADMLHYAGCKILIIDPLTELLAALDLTELNVSPVLTAFNALKHEAEIDELVVVHHAGHASKRPRGDSRLLGWPSAPWFLENRKGVRFFTAGPGRDVDAERVRLEYTEATRFLRATVPLSKEEEEKERKADDGKKDKRDVTEKILDFMEQAADEGQKIRSGNEIFRAIGGKRASVLAAWKELIEGGMIIGDRVSGFELNEDDDDG